jgi:hypothetical protein
VVVGHPLDTVKVHMQTGGRHGGVTHAVRAVARRGTFYAGWRPALAANASENAILFGCYGLWSPAVGPAISGGLSAFVTSVALCPIELYKVRAQARHAAIGVATAPPRLFAALGATMLREVPGNIAFFGTYESMVGMGLHASISGGFAGVAFWLVALPADNVKTHQQVHQTSFVGAVGAVARGGGFYRGLMPATLRAFPSNAALFWGVAAVKGYMD